MWKVPRLVAWCFISLLGYVLLRLTFAPFQIVPYCIEVNPGVAWVLLTGLGFGPAGVIGCLAGSIVTDFLLQVDMVRLCCRAVGTGMAGYGAMIAWQHLVAPSGNPRKFSLLLFLLVGMLASLLHASWSAFGIELVGYYPFSYTILLLLGHHAIVVLLFGLPGYLFMMRRLTPAFDDWTAWVGWDERVRHDPFSLVFLAGGGVMACLSGFLASTWLYGQSPRIISILGQSGGPWVEGLVIPFLVVQLAGLLWPARRTADAAGLRTSPLSWHHLMK